MVAKAMELSWVSVDNLKEAVKFYTEVLGLKLMELNEQYGWAELQAPNGGMRLGLGQKNEEYGMHVGNAIVTFTVDNLEKAMERIEKTGARCLGPIQEVPGEVRMQMFIYQGNHFQFCQMLK